MEPTKEQIRQALENALRVAEASRQGARAWGAGARALAIQEDVETLRWLIEREDGR